MNVSLCMIVKNEAASLSRCLESVQPIASELIVLDTGSTDRTVSIAQSLNAQVHHFAWCNDFAAARNESLKHAQGDWILVLDADEVLVPAVVPALQAAIADPNALVINLVRQEVGAVQSPYSLVSRLFRRHPALHFTRPYHASIDDSVTQLLKQEPDWQVIDLPDVALWHYGYEPGTIASRDKFQTARATMEGFLKANPLDPYECSKLGALYVEMGEVDRGITLLKRGLKSPQADAPILYELHYHLGIAYNQLQKLDIAPQPSAELRSKPLRDRAEKHYRLAIEQPILPQLRLGAYNNLGGILKAKGDLAGAKTVYEATLQIDPAFSIAHYNLGMTLKAMGKLLDAIVAYEQAIRLNPSYAEAYQNLGVVLLKLGRVSESMAAFRQAIELHELHNPVEADRLRQGVSDMGFVI